MSNKILLSANKILVNSDNKIMTFTDETELTRWLWATTAAGTALDNSNAVALDALGNCYITGYFSGTASFGNTVLTSSGSRDIFLAKLSSSGEWLWATKAAGSGEDNSLAVGVDASGNCYVAGSFQNTVTFGGYSITSVGYCDLFVAKANNAGVWQWAKTATGGNSANSANGLAVSAAGDCYIAGQFQGDTTFGSITLTNVYSDADYEAFVAKIDTTGTWLWATRATGPTWEYGHKIAIDASDNCYITGIFNSSIIMGSTTLTTQGANDIFVAKLNSSGAWQWATKAGGTGDDYGNNIATDSSGNCYITGYFNGSAMFGSTTLVSSGGQDIFVAKLNTNGNWLWAKKAGGDGNDAGNGIAVDSTGACIITGSFEGTANFGDTTLTSLGGRDIFVAKLSSSGNWDWALNAGGTGNDAGQGIAIDSFGHCYVTGHIGSAASFDTIDVTHSGSTDIFIAKLKDVSFTFLRYTINRLDTTPTPLPNNRCYAAALSGDGQKMATVSMGPNDAYEVGDLRTYAWNVTNSRFEGVPFDVAPRRPTDAVISEDGSTLVLAEFILNPYVNVYKWSGTSWIKVPVSGVSGTGGHCCGVSSDGSIVAVASATSANLSILRWNAGTSSYIKDTSALNVAPLYPSYGLGLSPNGEFIALSHTSSPYVTTYRWSGTQYVKTNNPNVLPPSAAGRAAISGDGSIMAVAFEVSPAAAYIYQWSTTNNRYEKIMDFSGHGATGMSTILISKDSKLIVAADNASGTVFAYRQTAPGIYARIESTTLIDGVGQKGAIALPKNGSYMTAMSVYDVAPYVNMLITVI